MMRIMKEYTVKTVNAPVNWTDAVKAPISEYVWGGEYRPEAYGQAVFVKNDGFYIKLTAKERDPKAVYTKNGDPVYKDSCLEFFAAYKPGGYINCEMNCNGAILSAYGEGRGNRTPINEIAGKYPEVKAEKTEKEWSVTVRVGLDIIKKVYGNCDFKPGDVFYGNFYKCGDGCEIPHYGSFSPIGTEKPDFHRPEYFAKFIIE